MKELTAYWKTALLILSLSVLMLCAKFFPKYCDKYTDKFYSRICDGVSKLTSRIPFALGEVLMFVGALAVVLCPIFLILLIFLHKKAKYRKFCAGFHKTVLMTLLCVVLIYMPTWYIPFSGTLLGEGTVARRDNFDNDQVGTLLRYSIEGANAAAEEIEIKEDGTVVFPDDEELHRKTVEAMKSLKDEYSRLAGYYPPVKRAMCSGILDHMGIGGYNYPFTMEPTINKYYDPLYLPFIEAHELAHHKGYYKENEANFLSMVALSESDDPFLRLSGFYQMYWYLIDEYNFPDDPSDEPYISERTEQIIDASTYILNQKYKSEPNAVDDSPQDVQQFISDVSDKGWDLQSEVLKENTYSGCVKLLLEYYYGKLY